MALVVNTNVASIQAQYNVNKTNQSMQDAMAALSSGKRINSAGDDAAGLSISTRMEAQVRGLSQAIRNANDGISLVDTAEGAMDEITSMLQRMRELSLQASNDTMNSQDRANLDAEIVQLKAEIDRVVENTRFNDKVLLDGSFSGSLQIGAKAPESLGFSVADMSTSSLGASSSAITGTASVSATAKGTEAVENVINLTFNGNDSYDLTITLDNESGAGATNKEISISGGTVAGFSAQDVADKINAAVAATAASGYTGVNLTGVLTASASGTTVTLVNKEGTEVDFTAFNSAGAGSMTVNPVTNSEASSVTLDEDAALTSLINSGGTAATASTSTLQLQEGFKYQFRVNDTLVSVDSTTAGIAAATNGNIAGLLSDVAADIEAAIDATSGALTGTVSTANSVSGTSMQFSMSDSTGAAIQISGFQKLTSSAVSAGFLTVEADISNPAPEIIENGEFITADQATGTGLEIAAGDTGRVQFSNQDLSYTFQFDADNDGTFTSYTVDGATKDFNAELTRVAEEISAEGGIDVTATNNGGVLEIVNNTADGLDFKGDTAIVAPGIDAVTEGTAFFLEDASPDNNIADNAGVITMVNGNIVRSTDGVAAVASQMSLSFSDDDRYTFSIDADGTGGGSSTEADATFTFDVTGGSLIPAMNSINALNSTTGITASIDGSELILSKADGTQFAVHGYSSEGGGQINAANAAGQGGSATLENATGGATHSVAATGAAVQTEVVLTLSDVADRYSFKVSDGVSTATVRSTAIDLTNGADNAAIDDDADTADLLSEIQGALSAANMSHIEASVSGNTDGTIKLVNKLGGSLNISDFVSDATGRMTVSPNSGQGVAKILDDDALSGSFDSIASINALTVASSQQAVQAIDRAIENVNDQRSKLGAISNRLDHTVSNLGNIVTNTEASQSRIQDADFAAESAKLAKNQILLQAGTAMLAQANASQQTVLSLLG